MSDSSVSEHDYNQIQNPDFSLMIYADSMEQIDLDNPEPKPPIQNEESKFDLSRNLSHDSERNGLELSVQDESIPNNSEQINPTTFNEGDIFVVDVSTFANIL